MTDNDGLPGAPVTEDASNLPPVSEASTTDTDLDRHIAEIAAGEFGADVNSERFNIGGNDGGSGDEGAAGAAAGEGSGKDGDQGGQAADEGAAAGAKPSEGGDNDEVAAGVTPPAKVDQPKAQPTVDAPNPELVKAPPADKVYEVKAVDADGKEHTFSSFDDIPDDFRPATNKESLRILRDLDNLEQERAADDLLREQAKTQEGQIEAEAARQQSVIASWNTEIDTLIKAGEMPEPKIKPGEPGSENDPGVKVMDQVFAFMQAENAKRPEGTARLSSFRDAFELMNLRNAQAKTQTDNEAAAARARAKAANIGSSGSRTGAGPVVYRAGQAQEISDLI